MHIPKVVFQKYSLEDNIEMIKAFYFDTKSDEDTFNSRKCVLEYYPALATLEQENLEFQEKKIEEEVTKLYVEHEEEVKEKIKHFQKVWDEVGEEVLKALSNYLNIEWSILDEEIEAKVGFVPICPRYLEDYSYVIDADASDEMIREISSHELCHFLWFEKIAMMYPEIPYKEYNVPYIPWKYSEMVIDPILNSYTINRYIGKNVRAYDEFYELVDSQNHILVMDNLKFIYQESIPIEEKIDKGYHYVKEIYRRRGRNK